MAATSGPKRSSQACKRCRQQKMKCTGGPDPCDRCTHMGRECIFEPASSNSATMRTNLYSRNNNGMPHTPLAPYPEPRNIPELQTPVSADVDQQRPAKRSRLDFRDTADHDSPHTFGAASPETPYIFVQSLEYQHHLNLPQRPPHHIYDTQATPSESSRHNGTGNQFLNILIEARISPADAEQMFHLFGDRIAPFFPTFYNTNFSQLPSSPVFGLAALHAIARYLPDAASMRVTLWQCLKTCLKELTFDVPDRTSVTAIENLQGLAILYGCCEASSPRSSGTDYHSDTPDMLTAKSLVEGYAVKLGVGQVGKSVPNKFFSYVWWLWLFTMSHHAAILHSCVRTMSGIGGLREAKSYVEQFNTHNAVKRLLGEADLCLIWERVHFDDVGSMAKIGKELHSWGDFWRDFLNRAEGRQLVFHQRFTTFQLYASAVHTEDEPSRQGTTRAVTAAQQFLHCTTRLSPVSKERLRYMCDFGFVMIAYACLFILRSTRSTPPGDHKAELLRDVQEAANLLQSYSAKKNVRPAIYGYALQKLCEGYPPATSGVQNFEVDRNVASNNSSGTLYASENTASVPEIASKQTTTPVVVQQQPTPTSASTFNVGLESPTVSGFGPYPTAGGLEGFLVGDTMETEVARSMSELWSLNQNFFTFGEDSLNGLPGGNS